MTGAEYKELRNLIGGLDSRVSHVEGMLKILIGVVLVAALPVIPAAIKYILA